ncbi:MAG: PKD domain-containing protein [Patescibacteria group bacterium]
MKKLASVSVGLLLLASPLLASADVISDLQAQIQALLARIVALQAQQGTVDAVPATSAAPSCVVLNYNMAFGDTDAITNGEVSKLQQFLTGTGDYTYGQTTGYFGPATEAAVKRYQARNGIVSSGTPETTGYGAVGPQTRARMAQECGGGGVSLAAAPTYGAAPLTVTFTAMGITPLNSDHTVSVGFNGGEVVLEKSLCNGKPCYVATYTYLYPGTYTAWIYKRTGNTVETLASRTVTVTDSGTQSPTLSASPTSGTAPLAVRFTASTGGNIIDFGDGTTATMPPPPPCYGCAQPTSWTQVHTYSAAGTYTAQLIRSDPGGCGATTDPRCLGAPASRQIIGTATITVTGTSAQHPTITASPTSGFAPLSVKFTLEKLNVQWQGATYAVVFGDGTASYTTSAVGKDTVSHTYASAGTYTATLIEQPPFVCNGPAGTACAQVMPAKRVVGTVTITVTGQSSATFSASPTSGPAPLTVTFTGRFFRTLGVIDFGDGNRRTITNFADSATGGNSIGEDPFAETYTYQKAGTYTAKLLDNSRVCATTGVVADCNVVGTVTITVTGGVGGGWPHFTVTPSTTGTAPLNLWFNVSGGSNFDIIDFGDGSTQLVNGVSTSIIHTYNTPGTYTAKLLHQDKTPYTNENAQPVTITVTGTTTSQSARIVFFSVKGESKVSPDSPVTLQFGTEHAARCDLFAVNDANASYMDQYNAGAFQTVAKDIGTGGAFGTPQSYYVVYPSTLARAEVSYVLACTGSNGPVALGNVHVQVSGMKDNGNLAGRVTVGPTCPVVSADNAAQCADRPLQTSINVYKNGAFVKTMWSDMNGYYNTILIAGTYELRANENSSSFYPRCNPVSATTKVGTNTIVNILCDSGIR